MLDLPGGLYVLAEEAAERLSLSPRLIRRVCAEGRVTGAVPLPGPDSPRLWLIPVAALDAWAGTRRRRGRPARVVE